MTDLPDPVPVAELIARRRRPGHYYYAGEGYLSYSEVVEAWPVVGYIGAVVRANEVRTVHKTGAVTTGWTEYHAGDVQRVADAIADGTAVLLPEWRKDTEEGREARRQWYEELRREAVLGRWIWSAVVLGLLVFIGVVWFLVARSS